MNESYHRAYKGRLKAAVLDWAGTTVDFGSFAPTAVFLKLFERSNVPITMAEARAPMGLAKKDHLQVIARMPSVAVRWREVHGRDVTDKDIDAMYSDFESMQTACLTDYATPIPGTLDTVARLRQLRMRIGSTTGYTRRMMEVLVPQARQRGYEPDVWVCPSDVPAGRPYPWMCYENAIRLGVFPMEAMVKIGDTLPDIEEGLNAGMWTIGLALSGNGLGVTEEELAAMPFNHVQARRKEIAGGMRAIGAHYVVDSIRQVVDVVLDINARLSRGERP